MDARESKRQLLELVGDSQDTVRWMFHRTSGSWESRRLQLLDTVPGVVGFYSEGSAALAADFYDESRVKVKGAPFAAAPVILDRTVRIRRGVAWASEPLSVDDVTVTLKRLEQIMAQEVARPYRDTTLENQQRDPAALGWRRVTSAGACGFCKALAARGAVYTKDTAYFAAHENCMCTCEAVFRGEVFQEADVMQYMASSRKRRKTPEQKQRLKDWIAEFE